MSYKRKTFTTLLLALLATILNFVRVNSDFKTRDNKPRNQAENRYSFAHQNDSKTVGGGRCPHRYDNTTKLFFIHIRKTGGTAIKVTAKKHGHREIVSSSKLIRPLLDKKRFKNATRRISIGSRHHIPPKYFDPYPYENNETSTFAISRDPYDRAVSEYYQTVERKKRADPNNVKYMNTYIQRAMKHPTKDLFIPQHHYLFGDDNKQLVTHILEFSRLKSDFDALMECYSIHGVKLPIHQINPRKSKAPMSRLNLTEPTVRTINYFMRKDFELLGYPMILDDDK